MRGKVAKAIRREAERQTWAKPAVGYLLVRPRGSRRPFVIVDPRTTRGRYLDLKDKRKRRRG